MNETGGEQSPWQTARALRRERLAAPEPGYPATRLRRSRRTEWSRRLVREHAVSASDLIWPLFVIEGDGARQPVAAMRGVDRLSIDLAVRAAEDAARLDIPVVALFPSLDPALRSADAREALNPANLVCRAVRAIKRAVPEIGILCDVALDPYTSHGHDGLMEDGAIANDPTVEVLARQALVQAEAGCDIIAPSDMMDGRVAAIRQSLEANGFTEVLIMAYSAKFASGLYGPFREAVASAGALVGDKKSYQMDPANGDEALREVEFDLAEGADMVMVKPGLPYLDVVSRVKRTFAVPTFVYQVSGEYAMIRAAAANGWLDGDRIVDECLLAFKRAGADGILTYFALEVARRMKTARG